MEHREELKKIKYLLFRLIDAIYLEKQYDTVEKKCENFDFAKAVCELAHEEQDLCMWSIQCILENILPKEKGIFSMIKRNIRFKRREPGKDYYPFNLYIRGYQKECQEFYCLVKLFNDVGMWFCKFDPICGYRKFLDVFYIDSEV